MCLVDTEASNLARLKSPTGDGKVFITVHPACVRLGLPGDGPLLLLVSICASFNRASAERNRASVNHKAKCCAFVQLPHYPSIIYVFEFTQQFFVL